MIIQQAELFRGMSSDFMKEFMDNTTKESHEGGDFVFREGDQAKNFYILLKGRVKLNTGREGKVVHTVDRPGETFGLSSLVDRDAYSASAECVGATKLLKNEREEFQKIVDKDPVTGAKFYKRLAASVGERLTSSYSSLSLAQASEEQRTYGSTLTLQQRSAESVS